MFRPTCSVLFVALAASAALAQSPKPADAPALPTTLFLAGPPAKAQEVAGAKKDAKEGQPILLHGRIGGSKDPFTPNRAIFTLVDASIPSCSDAGPKDHCPTPWDYCCEPKEKIVANAATIQVVGADGKPLKSGLKSLSGFEPGKEVWVVGKVAKTDNKVTLMVNATGLYAKGAPNSLPDHFFAADAPAQTIAPHQLEERKSDQTVTVRGRVPERDAFSPGRAEFVLEDPSATGRPLIIRVRVPGSKSETIPSNLEGVGGLAPGADIAVTGRMVRGKESNVIEASEVHVYVK